MELPGTGRGTDDISAGRCACRTAEHFLFLRCEGDMRLLTKKRLFIAKHWDFLLADLLAFALGYYISLAFRRSLKLNMYNQNLITVFWAAAIVSFLLVEIISENLKGVIARRVVREAEVVIGQMALTWCADLTILFLMHDIFALSRIFTAVSFALCTALILIFRTGWKMICKFSRKSEAVMPELLIVTEAGRAQTVLNRIVSGALSKEYEIRAIVTNGKGEEDYHDWYPMERGLEKIDRFTGERRVQMAYVELTDREEEKETIDRLLAAGIVVHRSLGDSRLEYADQEISELDGKSTIEIAGAGASLASRADQAWQRLRQKMSRERE